MNSKICISYVAVIVFLLTANPAQAGVLGADLGGALRGAFVGDLVDGRSGVPEGAVIGGLIGAGQAASSEKQANEAALKRKAEWEASKKAEQERIRPQQAVAEPQEAVENTLVLDTQKSLVRLGYDPGDIGIVGPALDKAVMEYQQSNGLQETGELSQELLTHMLRNGR